MVPPFVGEAVKVTDAPLQILVEDALMLTAGATLGVTVMVTLLELTVVVPAQGLEEVNWQLTTSPFTNEVVLKDERLVPTLFPFTLH